MKKENIVKSYGSIKVFYGNALVVSIFYGVTAFVLDICIYGYDSILNKAANCLFVIGSLFILGTFEVTFDIIMHNKKHSDIPEREIELEKEGDI